jgi:hypothetical protein
MQRVVFFVDKTHLLRCYRFSADDDEWEEVDLAHGNASPPKVDEQSKLSGSFLPGGGAVVLFQTCSKVFQGIVIRDWETGQWESLPKIPVNYQPGTSHSFHFGLEGENDHHILYVNQDNSIHHLKGQALDRIADWNGKSLPPSKLSWHH